MLAGKGLIWKNQPRELVNFSSQGQEVVDEDNKCTQIRAKGGI